MNSPVNVEVELDQHGSRVCCVQVVVAVFLHRPRPNDNTLGETSATNEIEIQSFPSLLSYRSTPFNAAYTFSDHLSAKLMDWYFGGVEVLTAIYTFTDYMLHPWIFNIAGMLLLEPFRKVFTGNMRPFSSFYRKYRSSSQTIPAVYRVPPPSYNDATQRTKPSRPTQMY
ncbi:hypothetical protein COOONC_22273 [Cooperia oncophora]